jgi:hypothetical protein
MVSIEPRSHDARQEFAVEGRYGPCGREAAAGIEPTYKALRTLA